MKTAQILCVLFCVNFAAAMAGGDARAESDETLQRTVSYADLNMNDPAGVQTLYQRLRIASRSVCGGSTQPVQHFANQQCVREALASAIARANIRPLTRYYSHRTRPSARPAAAIRR
jgi:UrcA family protein